MYLTYEQYQFMGGTLPETAFEDLEFQARTKIDWYTFNRLQNETEYPEAVKRCMYHLISLLEKINQAVSVSAEDNAGNITAGIASQSNDGVSISYNVLSAKDGINISDAKIKETIQMDLQGVKNSLGRRVLYRGLYPDE